MRSPTAHGPFGLLLPLVGLGLLAALVAVAWSDPGLEAAVLLLLSFCA